MAFVDLDSIHYFQPPRPLDRPLKGRSEHRTTPRKRDAFTISSEHYDSVASVPKTKTSGNLESCEPAGCIDLTYPPPMETGGDPLDKPAVSMRGTENIQGNTILL